MADIDLIDQVRLLTSDVDPNNRVFEDPDYTRFLALRGDDPRLAAATALRAMAGNVAQVQGKITLVDVAVDGPAAAKALLALADRYETEVDEAGTFDLAEPGGT